MGRLSPRDQQGLRDTIETLSSGSPEDAPLRDFVISREVASFRMRHTVSHTVVSEADGKMGVGGLHRKAGAALQHPKNLTRASALDEQTNTSILGCGVI